MFQNRIHDKIMTLDLIITSFAIIAKINTLLMTDCLFAKDCVNFQAAVKNARRLFQRLHKAASSAISASQQESRVSFSFFQRSSVLASTQVVESVKSAIKAALIKKSSSQNEFKKIIKCFNVYIDLHHQLTMNEYDICSNCNVLIEEDKH